MYLRNPIRYTTAPNYRGIRKLGIPSPMRIEPKDTDVQKLVSDTAVANQKPHLTGEVSSI